MTTFDRLRPIVAGILNIGEEQVTPETCLVADLAADSLDRVQVAMAVEEAFAIDFEEEAFGLTTVPQIVEYIERRLREKE